MPGKKMILRFYNNSGELQNTVKFLESIQKKVNFINLSVEVEGKTIKISLYGTKDLQYLARERLQDLARQFF
ncbi:MAG: hypothetical protein ACFFBP_06095 [Promethearchaeota archaeon]